MTKKEVGTGRNFVILFFVVSLLVAMKFSFLPYYVAHPGSNIEMHCSKSGKNCVTIVLQRDLGWNSPFTAILSFDSRPFLPWWPPSNRIEFSPDIDVDAEWMSDSSVRITVANGGQSYKLYGKMPNNIEIEMRFNG